MDLPVRLSLTLLAIFLSVGLLQYECKRLDGYKFPVYSTELCPENQTQYNERSLAINCTEKNGYLCFPNEHFTQLLEFCHSARFIWIEEGYCLYLEKDGSRIHSYNCNNFQYGCHNASFPSYQLFEYPGCTSIGNGCFLAEPSCEVSTTIDPLEITERKCLECIVGVIFGVLITLTGFCLLFIYYRIGYHSKRKTDKENQEEESKLSPSLQPNKQEITEENDSSSKIQLIESENTESIAEGHRRKQKSDEEHEEKEEDEYESSTFIQPIESENTESVAEESPLHRDMFQQWKEEDNKFVSTRACKKVEKLIKSQNLVVVTGNSGSGKSAILQHIALRYRSHHWIVKPIYSVKEIEHEYGRQDKRQNRTLLIFNDPIGNESFDEEKYKLWKDYKERLNVCLKKIKMLVSCRRYIFNDARVSGILKDTSCTCMIDLNDDQHKLNIEEKRKMLEKYSSTCGSLKENIDEIDEIVKTEEYFPLLCKLFFSDKNNRKMGVEFFKQPIEECSKLIEYFKLESKANYCVLVLLVLFNNKLCVDDIETSDISDTKFKLALKLCGMQPETATSAIKQTLKNLEGFFIKKIRDNYHFYHDFVMEVATYVFGKDYPKEIIQYADVGFLRRRVNLENDKDQNNQFEICLSDKYSNNLGERLYREMFGDRLLDVVLNPCMRNEKLATFFIQKLNNSPDDLNKLLAKKRLYEGFKYQDGNQALEHSFGSKLDYLFYEDEMSILTAIIVFCHTKFSSHCLKKALKQKKTSFKGNNLFSAVCCNGSMNLFNVFPKKKIAKFMMEKSTRTCLKPIHIASLFHNHKILHELIQVKNEVNLHSVETYGLTPLMLTAFNMVESEQNNKDRRTQSIDSTLKLLLDNGADINECHLIAGSPLSIASTQGNDYIVKLLLENGAKTNICNYYMETPLHLASEQGHESIVKLLLDKGADIHSYSCDAETPLQKACKREHKGVVKLLLDKGADINSCSKYKDSPLHEASAEGRESTVDFLLDKGANNNLGKKYKETPLHKACIRGHESIVIFLLNKDANINSSTYIGNTPLHIACEWRHESIAQLLIDKGADINACNIYKETPLHKASEWRNESIMQSLLDKEADINFCNKKTGTPLHEASLYGPTSFVQLLINKGANINSLNKQQQTPLHEACRTGQNSIVQILLDQGAAINCCDRKKQTPLYRASKWGHDSTVQLLLGKGADINAGTVTGETPLSIASHFGNYNTVQLLLNKGADINSCDMLNETPLHRASRNGHNSTVKLLLDKGADINFCNDRKRTPLHIAGCFGHKSTMQLLKSEGANVNLRDQDGKTPHLKARNRIEHSIVCGDSDSD